jgi:hypothetical protein
MKINKEWVKKQGACQGGSTWFNETYKGDVDGIEVVKTLLEHTPTEESLSWANWLIVRLMTRKQYLQYAVFAAEQVIHIHEKNYPEDNTVRACIEAAKSVIENDTAENRQKATAAWAAAWDAAWAAARDAAWAAAWDAARDAAWAAAWDAARAAARDAARAAAWDAARDAAWAAAWDAAWDAMLKKILNYGLELIESK